MYFAWMVQNLQHLMYFNVVCFFRIFFHVAQISLKEQNSKETCRPNIEELVDITTFTEMKNPWDAYFSINKHFNELTTFILNTSSLMHHL